MEVLTKPWPWYVAGPILGLMVPAMLLLCNKQLGISSTLRHICAACIPTKATFFKYNWRADIWNLVFALGLVLGGFVAGVVFRNPDPVQISEATVANLNQWGIHDYSGLMSSDIFSFGALLTLRGFILIVGGGLLVGFGTRYANGCTSGHTIMGLSNLQFPSLVASICFFAGGTFLTWVILPFIMKL
jgi:uncharacterized membrane protein YedE/YeeE